MVAIKESDNEMEMVYESIENPTMTPTRTTTMDSHHDEFDNIHNNNVVPVYKEVVVIGNGPSGIVTSYFLAGNWPYYNGHGEGVNEMLHYRLLNAGKSKSSGNNKRSKKISATTIMEDNNNNNNDSYEEEEAEETGISSIVEQDLHYLAQGLEGRSNNPTSLLFDILNHPQADLGLELPSLLDWRHDPSKSIDHVVIGKGSPGGTWKSMDGSVLTISLGCWMELPQLNFREWEATQVSRCCCESRATVSSVASYYDDYVSRHGLGKYFLNDSVITSVVQIPAKTERRCRLPINTNSNICDNATCIINNNIKKKSHRLSNNYNNMEEDKYLMDDEESESNTFNSSSQIIPKNNDSRPLWKVNGYTRKCIQLPHNDNETDVDGPTHNNKNSTSINIIEPFTFLTPNLVLATGSSDKSNSLNIPGEDLPFVLHSLNDLERLIVSGQLNSSSDPILVVGAGLCAADAIIAAKFHSIPIIHIFRRNVNDPNLIFRQLPENMYPEYHKVYSMMKDSSGYDHYKAYEQHKLLSISPNHEIRVAGPNCCGKTKISVVVICIGSHPDLSLLGSLENQLGVQPGAPIDCKANPILIEPTSHQSSRVPGLFALGPLVGENFVRFLQGGALAITNHLVKLQANNSSNNNNKLVHSSNSAILLDQHQDEQQKQQVFIPSSLEMKHDDVDDEESSSPTTKSCII